MKFKKILVFVAAFAIAITVVPQTSSAQWSIGASYEIRNEEPKNGFGFRVERGLLKKLPVLNLGLRAHFSYFNEDINRQNFSGDIQSYDYGLAAVAGVSIALISPYVGAGLGSTNFEGFNVSESDLYWNGFVGAKVSPIPKLKPFVEYRFQSADSFGSLSNNASIGDIGGNSGRLIFGLSLSF